MHRRAGRYARWAGQTADGHDDEQAPARHEAAGRADRAAVCAEPAESARRWARSGAGAGGAHLYPCQGVRHVRQSRPNAPRVRTSLDKRFALRRGQPQRLVRGARRLVRTPSIGGASHLKILDLRVYLIPGKGRSTVRTNYGFIMYTQSQDDKVYKLRLHHIYKLQITASLCIHKSG